MIKITADSSCDLSKEILNSMDISLTPLYINFEDKALKDGVEVSPEDIFEYTDREGKMCKTSAVNLYDYVCLFEELSPKYEAVIHICLGSRFSSCYQNAVVAAQNFDNVYVIDSGNLSSGSGHLVYDAALMAKEGIEAKEICRRIEESVPHVDASFVIDRLDYLHKGGRCSGLEAAGARLLHIKPSIEVVNGEMKIGKKYRGSFERCLEQYIKDKLSNSEDIDYSRVFITHPACRPETVEMVKKMLREHSHFREIIETRAGSTVSCHCGPSTLGILFKRKRKKAV